MNQHYTTFGKAFRKGLALCLVVVMVFGLTPQTAFAYMREAEAPLAIVTEGGKTVTPDDSWEEEFPYGTFAFSMNEAQVTEGEQQKLPVYRLGGTKGSAVIEITYFPAIAQISETETSYTNALSSDDLSMRVEDPLPIAQYQPRGKAKPPTPAPDKVSLKADKADKNGDITVKLLGAPDDAKKYQWYVFSEDQWTKVDDATEAEFVAAKEDFESVDIRAEYTADGKRWCTDSVKGLAYDPETEISSLVAKYPSLAAQNDSVAAQNESESIAAQNDSSASETTYTKLPMDAKDKYSGYTFTMEFAEGETVKDILIDTRDDKTSEAGEFGVFTITDNDGGELYDTANKFTFHVADNDGILPSKIGFAVKEITVDKSDGKAVLTIERSGSLNEVLSIDYATKDGSAKQGKDYQTKKGTAAFYPGAKEALIEVPLINDKTKATRYKDFTVTLSNLKGDREDKVTLGELTATVHLFNTADATEDNIATRLVDPNATDVSATVREAEEAIAPVSAPVVTGEDVTEIPEPVLAEIVFPEAAAREKGLSLLSHDYGTAYLDFGKNSAVWRSRSVLSGYDQYDAVNADKVALDIWGVGDLYLYNHNGKIEARSQSAPWLYWRALNVNLLYERLDADFVAHTPYRPGAFSTDSTAHYIFQTRREPLGASPFEVLASKEYEHNLYGQNPDVKETLSQVIDIKDGQIGREYALEMGVTGGAENGHPNADNAVFLTMTKGAFTRRAFQNPLGLKIYTANDADRNLSSEYAVFTEDMYEGSVKPKIEIVDGAGGANGSGKLFVGSKLRVSFANPAYKVHDGDSVFLTNASGTTVATGTKVSEGVYDIELMWNGMSVDDIANGNFKLNVVVDRVQEIELDITPSVPRLPDNPMAIDTTKIRDAWQAFIRSGYSDYISWWYHSGGSVLTPGDNIFGTNLGNKHEQSLGSTPGNPPTTASITVASGIKNLQYVNFDKDPEDLIVYNGNSYAGNEDIYLAPKDLSSTKLTFRYYAKEYKSALSVMTTSISKTAVYFDKNANGRIDGHFNEYTGEFYLDQDTDELITYLKDREDYDEHWFAPVKTSDGKWQTYFLKTFYTMTPRALVVPPGGSEEDRAQVMPAFITDVTNETTLTRLTPEQQAYRYIVSGKSKIRKAVNGAQSDIYTALDYTADNHLMYSAAATATSFVDTPLGGDRAPAHFETVDSEKVGVWKPDFLGNLLYPFTTPEAIYIPNSIAGENTPIGDDAKVNNYLGSWVDNDTLSLNVQQQTSSTGAIIQNQNAGARTIRAASDFPVPESLKHLQSGLFPNADYLRQLASGGDTGEASADMDDSDNEFSEFNMDMGINLPSLEIPITGDYVTVVMDGYQVGFAIGVPLGGYSKANGEKGERKTPLSANKDNAENYGKVRNFMKSVLSKELKKGLSGDDSFKDALGGKAGKMSSGQFEVSFSLSLAFMFEYNNLDNGYYFKELALSVNGAMSYRYQYRFHPVPIIYVYVHVGIEVEIGTGMTVDRVAKEETQLYRNKEGLTLKKGDSYVFERAINHKAVNLRFSGALNVKVAAQTATAGSDPALDSTRQGKISSDGKEPVTVVFQKVKGGYLRVNEDSNAVDMKGRVIVTAVTDTVIYRAVEVSEAETKVYWKGVSISPEAFVEAGAGIGVEFLKAEVFIKLAVSAALSLGPYERSYNTDTESWSGKNGPFSFDEFEMALTLGVRVVLLIFTYEMDMIGYKINYENGSGWSHSWVALGKDHEIGTLRAKSPGGETQTEYYKVTMPGDTSKTQQIYSPEDSGAAQNDIRKLWNDITGDIGTARGGIGALAITPPSYSDAPFALSGYGSSGDAFKLADGLRAGYDYRVVTVGSDNYVVYTYGRKTAGYATDNTMLVLSKLKLTSKDGKDVYGLVNPNNETDATPYIVIDDDGTGDLGFNAWSDGTDIHVIWENYATRTTTFETKPTEPDKDVFSKPTYKDGANTVAMDKENYLDTRFKPTAPLGTEPTEPLTSDYYFTSTSGVAHAGFTEVMTTDATPVGTGKYYKTVYGNYAGAEAAYTADKLTYDNDIEEWKKAEAVWNAYDKWYDYFEQLGSYNAFIAGLSVTASKNTNIKIAAYTPGGTAFGLATDVSGAVGAHVFLPASAGDGSLRVYAQAQYNSSETTTAVANLKGYLEANSELPQMAAYRLATQKAQWDLFGYGSNLMAQTGTGAAVAVDLDEKSAENIQIVKAGTDRYYVSYTTSELVQETKGTPTDYKDDTLATIRRLYLRELTITGGVPVWGDAKEVRKIIDYDDNEIAKDGYYDGGNLVPYTDPYFANLKFLNGKLGLGGESGAQDFLLFDMNGSTYVAPKADLDKILSGASATIYPFFKPEEATNQDGSKATETTTGRASATIGADGDGNISAVYIGGVPSSLNNAVYLTKYDPEVQKWGVGTMLAMRDMQVYEDSITNALTPEETEKRYLKELYDKDDDTTAQMLTFANPQIALGRKAGINGASESTLLVLTQGTLRDLKLETVTIDGDSKESVLPDGDGSVGVYALSYGVGGQGIGEDRLTFANYNFSSGYVLSPNLSFVNTGDVAIRGSEANPITVKLGVDAAVGQPDLAEWKIKENILPGQKVALSAEECKALTNTLQKGDKFYISIGEYSDYFDPAFGYSTLSNGGTLIVEEKPELGFEEFDVNPVSVNENGDTVLDVNLFASNRGSEKAEDVYIQFSYESGKDASGAPVYTPINLSKGGMTLKTDPEETLEKFGPLAAPSTPAELESGIWNLYNGNDGGEMSKDRGRRVSGHIVVPAECYSAADGEGEAGRINLRAEIFSKTDTVSMDGNGLKVTEHNSEYDASNNVRSLLIPQATFFTVADKIRIAQGNTMQLAVKYDTTTGNTVPDITAEEVAVPGDTELNKLGILYYKNTGYDKKGHGTGVVVIMPSKIGTGVIQLRDVNTNTTYPIAFEVTAFGEGIDIHKDNNMFTFKNKNGSVYDPGAAAGTQDWTFMDQAETWGENGAKPYQYTTSRGKVGTTIAFTTVADKITLDFMGTVDVASTMQGFATKTITGDKANNYRAEIDFGNPNGYQHTVTLTVKTSAEVTAAVFDKLIESYGSNQPPTPSDDKFSPSIYWSRSFPATASIKNGASTTIDLKAFILDDSGLASVKVNGTEVVPGQKGVRKSPDTLPGTLLSIPFEIDKNQTIKIEAIDIAGNKTTRTVVVDWFYDGTSTTDGKGVDVPDLTSSFAKRGSDGSFAALGPDEYITDGGSAYLKPGSATTGAGLEVSAFVPTEDADGHSSITQSNIADDADGDADGYYKIGNGFYRARSVGSNPGDWSAEFVYMDRMDSETPIASLNSRDAGAGQRELVWSADKTGGIAVFKQANINGFDLGIPAAQKHIGDTFGIAFGGYYKLTAEDVAGNKATAETNVENVVIAAGTDAQGKGALTVTNPTPALPGKAANDDGMIEVNEALITGGLYDPAASEPDTNQYKGSYEYLLLTAEAAKGQPFVGAHPDPANAADLAWVQDTLFGTDYESRWSKMTDYPDLEPGAYTLYVRDALDKDNKGRYNAKTLLALTRVIGNETISIFEIPNIQPPVPGEKPGSSTFETKEYTVAVTWQPALPADGKFAYETAYTALITITPKPGYTLEGVPENSFTVAGAERVSHGKDNGIVTAVFPKTDEAPVTPPVVDPSPVDPSPADPLGPTDGDTKAPGKVKVKLSANGGKIGKAKTKTVTLETGKSIGKLPTPKRAKYKFTGWYTKKSGGKKITTKTKVTKATTFYAHWKKLTKYGMVANATALKVRSMPSYHGNVKTIVGYMKAGDTFKIRGSIKFKSKTSRWYILTWKGHTAYVYGKYVKVVYK